MKHAVWLAAALAGACGDNLPCDPETPFSICTIAGNGDQGYSRRDEGKLATEVPLYVPQDTAIAPNGNLWVLDFNNYLVRELEPDGTLVRVVGTGMLGDSPAPGEQTCPALDAFFNHTPSMFFDDGYLYLAAWHASWIKRVKLDGMTLENFAGRGRRTHYDGDGGPALMASLDLPSSVAHDADGNIVIMDQASQVIRMVDKTGTIQRIAGKCVIDLDQPCAPGVAPVACPDPAVAGGYSNKFACGDLTTECSKPCTPGYGGDGGPALEARLAQPYGQSADPAGRIAYDHNGNLLIADTFNNRIRKVDRAGIITTFAGNGIAGFAGDFGPALSATINHPIDIAVADDNSVYFTDTGNNCVRKVDPTGTISTVVGRCLPNDEAGGVFNGGFGGDGGIPQHATLDRPYGIELRGDKLYVADSYNNRIRVVNLNRP